MSIEADRFGGGWASPFMCADNLLAALVNVMPLSVILPMSQCIVCRNVVFY